MKSDMIPMTQDYPIAGLSDDDLVSRLRRLAHGSRLLLATFIAHLQAFDDRRLHEPRGFPSLFQYCTVELRLSADEAYLRIYAARLAKAHPRILIMLARGEMHLSGLSKLGPRLTPENAEELLSRASGKSKRDIERLCAPLLPGPPARDKIQFFRRPVPAVETPTQETIPAQGMIPIQEALSNLEPAPAEEAKWCPVEEGDPSADERLVQISFIAAEGLWVKIDRAKGLLRHKHPLGRLEDVFSDALDVLLAKKDPAARLAGSRPSRRRPTPSGPPTRHVRRAVKDLVWRRDEGRCAFISPEGRRCDAVEFLEFDHVRPWAAGGSSDDPANIRLLCRTHNALMARAIFGDHRNRGGNE